MKTPVLIDSVSDDFRYVYIEEVLEFTTVFKYTLYLTTTVSNFHAEVDNLLLNVDAVIFKIAI